MIRILRRGPQRAPNAQDLQKRLRVSSIKSPDVPSGHAHCVVLPVLPRLEEGQAAFEFLMSCGGKYK